MSSDCDSDSQVFAPNNLIGSGSQGTVRDGDWNNEPCAVKTCFHRRYWEREVEVLKKTDHPNVVKMFGYNSDDKKIYMELADTDLWYWLIRQDGKIDKKTFWKIAKEILLGVFHIHRNGYIHRDIKPDNVLMKNDGTVCIADMALATKEGAFAPVAGTKGYIHPRWKFTSVTRVRAEDDLYAVGKVLGQVLSRMKPSRRRWKKGFKFVNQVEKGLTPILRLLDRIPTARKPQQNNPDKNQPHD